MDCGYRYLGSLAFCLKCSNHT